MGAYSSHIAALPSSAAARPDRRSSFTATERALLSHVDDGGSRRWAAREDLVVEGAAAPAVHLLIDGWACTYRQLDDRRRQITGFLLPGDLSDADTSTETRAAQSVMALTPLATTMFDRDDVERAANAFPKLRQAMLRQMMGGLAIQREWTVSTGRRTATERIAHLFCELLTRLEAVGLTEGDEFDLPITQIDIADATGLTSVHVNRVIQQLRSDGLIRLERRRLQVRDRRALERTGEFDGAYLEAQLVALRGTAERDAQRQSASMWKDLRHLVGRTEIRPA